ncbi:MAG: hypothetical protein K2P85_00525 [Flavobacteriaceae bacterium]|nr:hypothetical protein [Flavobacteriaceae bacterium]
MIDLLKELVDKPEKAKKYIINLIEFIMLSIVTSKLYIHFFGNYVPILIGDKNFLHDIFDFVISGTILIVIFIFFGLKYLALEYIEGAILFITHLIINNLAPKSSKFEDNKLIRTLFAFFKVIEQPTENLKFPIPGKNFNIVYQLIKTNEKESIKLEMNVFKQSFILEIYNLYCLFIITYFFILNIESNIFFNILIILGWFLLTFFLLVIQFVYEFIDRNFSDLVFGFKLINQIYLTNNYITQNKITLILSLEKTYSHLKIINFNNKVIAIEHFTGNRLANEFVNPQDSFKTGKSILITSVKLPIFIIDNLNKIQNLTILEYKNNDKEFLSELEKTIIN